MTLRSGVAGALVDYQGETGATITVTLTGVQAGDTVALFQAVDYAYPISAIPALTSTEITLTRRTADLPVQGDEAFTICWTGVATEANPTVTAASGARDSVAGLLWWGFVGAATFVAAAASTGPAAQSTSMIAPTLTGGASGDTLLCGWQADFDSRAAITTPTPPMLGRIGDEIDAADPYGGAIAGAHEVRSSTAATGTRTATQSGARHWGAGSMLIRPAAALVGPEPGRMLLAV